MFRIVSQIVFRKFRKYEFCKVSQIQVSQFYVCLASRGSLAGLGFARFRKCEFSKVSQIQVSQEFANMFFVSQGFARFARFSQRNGQFADGVQRLYKL